MDKIKRIYMRLKNWWYKYPLFSSLAIFILTFLVLASIYIFNPGISATDDHFFHFKYAYLLRTEGWDVVKDFKWIYFTKWAQDHDAYPISLFQISLVPFTFIKDMLLGLKISDMFWGSSFIALFYYLLRKSKLEYPLFFIIILISSSYFLQRMLLGRALVLTIALIFWEMYFAINKKSKSLFLISLFHIMWHQTTFLLPLLIVAITETARYLEEKRLFLKNALAAMLAIVFGMLFFPGYPNNIIYWTKATLFVQQSAISANGKIEGIEMYPRDPLDMLFSKTELFFLIFLIASGVLFYYYVLNKRRGISGLSNESKALSIQMYAAFLMTIVSLAGSITISGRFLDYYFPSAIFFIATVITKVKKDGLIKSGLGLSYVLSPIIIFFVLFTGDNFLNVQTEISRRDYRPFKEVSNWVESKSNDKETIFLNNWSWFAMSFFYNDKNYYSMGIEPQSLREYDPVLFWKWYNIFMHGIDCDEQNDCSDKAAEFKNKYSKLDEDGKKNLIKENGEKIIKVIKDDFKSRLIISDSKTLNQAISSNSDLVESSFESKSEYSGALVTAFKLK